MASQAAQPNWPYPGQMGQAAKLAVSRAFNQGFRTNTFWALYACSEGPIESDFNFISPLSVLCAHIFFQFFQVSEPVTLQLFVTQVDVFSTFQYLFAFFCVAPDRQSISMAELLGFPCSLEILAVLIKRMWKTSLLQSSV